MEIVFRFMFVDPFLALFCLKSIDATGNRGLRAASRQRFVCWTGNLACTYPECYSPVFFAITWRVISDL